MKKTFFLIVALSVYTPYTSTIPVDGVEGGFVPEETGTKNELGKLEERTSPDYNDGIGNDTAKTNAGEPVNPFRDDKTEDPTSDVWYDAQENFDKDDAGNGDQNTTNQTREPIDPRTATTLGTDATDTTSSTDRQQEGSVLGKDDTPSGKTDDPQTNPTKQTDDRAQSVDGEEVGLGKTEQPAKEPARKKITPEEAESLLQEIKDHTNARDNFLSDPGKFFSETFLKDDHANTRQNGVAEHYKRIKELEKRLKKTDIDKKMYPELFQAKKEFLEQAQELNEKILKDLSQSTVGFNELLREIAQNITGTKPNKNYFGYRYSRTSNIAQLRAENIIELLKKENEKLSKEDVSNFAIVLDNAYTSAVGAAHIDNNATISFKTAWELLLKKDSEIRKANPLTLEQQKRVMEDILKREGKNHFLFLYQHKNAEDFLDLFNLDEIVRLSSKNGEFKTFFKDRTGLYATEPPTMIIEKRKNLKSHILDSLLYKINEKIEEKAKRTKPVDGSKSTESRSIKEELGSTTNQTRAPLDPQITTTLNTDTTDTTSSTDGQQEGSVLGKDDTPSDKTDDPQTNPIKQTDGPATRAQSGDGEGTGLRRTEKQEDSSLGKSDDSDDDNTRSDNDGEEVGLGKTEQPAKEIPNGEIETTRGEPEVLTGKQLEEKQKMLQMELVLDSKDSEARKMFERSILTLKERDKLSNLVDEISEIYAPKDKGIHHQRNTEIKEKYKKIMDLNDKYKETGEKIKKLKEERDELDKKEHESEQITDPFAQDGTHTMAMQLVDLSVKISDLNDQQRKEFETVSKEMKNFYLEFSGEIIERKLRLAQQVLESNLTGRKRTVIAYIKDIFLLFLKFFIWNDYSHGNRALRFTDDTTWKNRPHNPVDESLRLETYRAIRKVKKISEADLLSPNKKTQDTISNAFKVIKRLSEATNNAPQGHTHKRNMVEQKRYEKVAKLIRKAQEMIRKINTKYSEAASTNPSP